MGGAREYGRPEEGRRLGHQVVGLLGAGGGFNRQVFVL